MGHVEGRQSTGDREGGAGHEGNLHISRRGVRESNTYGRIAAFFSGIPIIIASERNISEIGKDKKRHEIIIDQFLSIFTHQIICNSFNCYDSIVNNYSINKGKVITIHNGIDVSRYSKKDLTVFKNNSEKKVIGTVGRLEHQKNHRHFLRMAKILMEKSENIYLEFLKIIAQRILVYN